MSIMYFNPWRWLDTRFTQLSLQISQSQETIMASQTAGFTALQNEVTALQASVQAEISQAVTDLQNGQNAGTPDDAINTVTANLIALQAKIDAATVTLTPAPATPTSTPVPDPGATGTVTPTSTNTPVANIKKV